MELNDPDYEMYLSCLRDIDSWRIKESLEKCILQCEFMPKVKDIIDRLPDIPIQSSKPELKEVKRWTEPFSATKVTEYIEYEGGYKQVRIIPRG